MVLLLRFGHGYVEGVLLLFQMNLVKTKNWKKSIKKTISAIFFLSYMMVFQKLKTNVKMIRIGEYDVYYVLHEQLYRIKTHARRGPRIRKILQVIDENDEDVTYDLNTFLGPLEDFHRIPYTPKDLGYRSLTFNMANGGHQTFGEGDVMDSDRLHRPTL